MENWRGLFRERFVIEENTEEKYLRRYDHRTIVEELEHFIEQELDRAREEVLYEIKDEIFFGEVVENLGEKISKERIKNIIDDKLSKLTAK